MSQLLICLLLLVSGVLGKSGTENREREGRLFSLFSIVQFQQSTCVTAADNTMRGTCMTSSECSSAGGSASGNCAAGFGVCCLFTVTCGTGPQNVNMNSEYPSSAAAGTTCTFMFSRICPNLCQIRLDFNNLVTALPAISTATFGTCVDTVTVTSSAGTSPPVVCGQLTGQHMYLETGTTGTAGQIALAFVSPPATATRTFKIKVTYHTCDNAAKAPAGCVQYFTGTSGSFQSYNYQGGVLLRRQNYQTCIRQEQGYCSVNYNSDATTTPDPFGLLISPNKPTTMSTVGGCKFAYLSIPNTVEASNTFCGGIFNPQDAMAVPGTVIGNIAPFTVQTFFGNPPTINGLTAIELSGYNLDYTLVPCHG